MARKDILTRLADAGEEAIAKLSDTPGADRMLGAMTSMRDRMDELQKRVRGLDDLERRVAELERRLDADRAKGATAARSSAGRTTKAATRKTPATKQSGTKTSGAKTSSPKAGGQGAKPPKEAEGGAGSTSRAGSDSPG